MELKSREKFTNLNSTISTSGTSSPFALTTCHKILLGIGALFITIIILLMTTATGGVEAEGNLNENEVVYHFQLAKIFSSNMVLPRSPGRAKIWGWCDTPTCNVNVTFNNRTYIAIGDTTKDTNSLYRWEAKLPRTDAGGPYSIDIQSRGNSMTLKNVLFGDIYLCAGQSNMQFTVLQAMDGKKELEGSRGYTKIRLFTVGTSTSDHEQPDFTSVEQSWSMPSPSSLTGTDDFTYFSAVCWFFGKNFYDRHKVPIGLITTAANGTPIQTWIPEANFGPCAEFEPSVAELECCPTNHSVTFNTYISPIAKLQVTGVLWYQGESNIFNTEYYPCAMTQLVKGWRDAFENPILPFFYVQLHPFFVSPGDNYLPNFRLAQASILNLVDNIYMTTAVDLGDMLSRYDTLHPRYKREIGERLEKLVSRVLYNETLNLPLPVPSHAKLLNTVKPYNLDEDHKFIIQIQFQPGTVGTSLILKQVQCPLGAGAYCGVQYEIYFEDIDRWVPASGYINFDRISLYISVPYKQSARPTKVRYAYGDWPQISVYNANNLPCGPFLLDVIA